MNKPVLDMTAGSRMMWPNKNNELAAFADIRTGRYEMKDRGNLREVNVNPEFIIDWSQPNGMPFESDSFYQVIFDPPHLLRAGEHSWLRKKYGVLEDSWREDLEQGFKEAARVLKSNGTLIFKWNTDQLKLSEVLKLVPDSLVQTIQNRVNKTYICVFIKVEKESNHECAVYNINI